MGVHRPCLQAAAKRVKVPDRSAERSVLSAPALREQTEKHQRRLSEKLKGSAADAGHCARRPRALVASAPPGTRADMTVR